MCKKILIFSIAQMLLLGLTGAVTKSYQAENYDVDIQLKSDGTAIVMETVQMKFTGGPFTFYSRDLDSRNTDGYGDIFGAYDGQLLDQGYAPGMLQLTTSSSKTAVRFNLFPTSDSTHIFMLNYLVKGVIRKDKGDGFLWQAIPTEHDYAIASSTITITYPPDAQLNGEPVLAGKKGIYQSDKNSFSFTVTDLKPNEGVQVNAVFKKDSLSKTTPAWQMKQLEKQNQIAKVVPNGVWAGLVIYLLVSAGIFLDSRKLKRKLPRPGPVPFNGSIPSSEKPAIAAWLAASGNAYNPSQGLATMFDLCRQGVISIKNSPPRKWLPKDYLIFRGDPQVPLSAHETELMSLLFETRKGIKDQVFLSEAGNRIAQSSHGYELAIRNEMETAGLLDASRLKNRQSIQSSSLVAMVISLLTAITGFVMGSFAVDAADWHQLLIAAILTGAGVGFFFGGITGILTGSSISILTDEGERIAALWAGFKGGLGSIIKGVEPIPSTDAFNRFLPYATGFGLGESWVTFFQKLGLTQIPDWLKDIMTTDSGIMDTASLVVLMTAANASIGGGDSGTSTSGSASGGGSSGAG